MPRIASITLLALAVASSACQRNKTLAVFGLLDQSDTLSADQRDQLTEHLIGALGQSGKQRVLPRARTEGLCPSLEPDCLAAQAKKLEAGGYTTARVLEHGPECSLVLKYFRTKDRAARFSTAVKSPCDPAGLVTAIDLAALRLLSPDPSADQREVEAAMRARMQAQAAQRRKTEMRRAEEQAKRAQEEARRAAEEARLKAQAAKLWAETPNEPQEAPPAEAADESVRLDRAQIMKVFKRGKRQLLSCLRLHPKLSGPGPLRLRLELTIQPSGEVSKVVAGPEDVFSAVRSCVEEKARRWRFPAYEGRATTVSLPVVMSP